MNINESLKHTTEGSIPLTAVPKIISIDLGTKNLAYSLFSSDNTLRDFFIINPHMQTKSAFQRCQFITKFLAQFPTLNLLVIEKQLPQNAVLFALMYGFVSAFMVMHPRGKIQIVSPIAKFDNLNIKCDTKNKNHKRRIVEVLIEYPNEFQKKKLSTFEKKDDIADCVMQFLSA
jgi:hypothetical protein